MLWFFTTSIGRKAVAFCVAAVAVFGLLAEVFRKGKQSAVAEQEHKALEEVRQAREIENEVEAVKPDVRRGSLAKWVSDDK